MESVPCHDNTIPLAPLSHPYAICQLESFSGVLKAHRNGVPTNHPLRRAENRAKRAAGKSSECCRTCFGHDLILFAGTATDPDGSYHLAVLLQRNSPGENHNLPVIRCVNAEKLPARL